ncbi:MAG: carbohydrate-binding family 6 protein [Verrucomicrobiota bacterium]
MKPILFFFALISASVFAADSPKIDFAKEALDKALKSRSEKLNVVFEIDSESEDLENEGFKVIKEKGQVRVVGKDEPGAMYGGLDLAETIQSEGVLSIANKTENPYMRMRGTKFNIPLDVRTPSYTDVSQSAQVNMPEMWNMDFWKDYIDTLASYRYNYVSLWSLQPFPSIVHVPEYPDISLDDVKRSKGPFREFYNWNGKGWDGEAFLEKNIETIIEITMEEKIAFWREVMAYGKSRNVDFYFITWNIFDYGIEGKYGINDYYKNETTIDYYRHATKALFLTYPDLAGIGITTGENMRERPTGQKKGPHLPPEVAESWIQKTYMAGTLDALKEQPERKIRFIHRQHLSGADVVMDMMKPLIEHPNVDFIFSFKYAKGHVMSATRQPYHEGGDGEPNFVESIQGKVNTIWTMRNDSNYLFRWAAPDFVREFVKNIPYEVTQGYYYGGDGYINGRDFTELDPEQPRQLEVEKHWLHWMLWGRMAYDPDYSNERIAALLDARYPEVDGEKLLEAWQQVSMVYPRVTGFHWGDIDARWYIEGTRSADFYIKKMKARTKSGFHDVETFINVPTHQYGDVQSIPEFVAGEAIEKQSPLERADVIESEVDHALQTVASFGDVEGRELKKTLADIEIIGWMGKFYADQIRGATYVALARKSKKQADKDKAIEALKRAAKSYQKYVELVTATRLNRIWFNRVGYLDFKAQVQDAIDQIEIARELEVSP